MKGFKQEISTYSIKGFRKVDANHFTINIASLYLDWFRKLRELVLSNQRAKQSKTKADTTLLSTHLKTARSYKCNSQSLRFHPPLPSPQVVSLLRLKHNIKAEVCQLTSCDYIVSNRMAVKRKSASGKLEI